MLDSCVGSRYFSGVVHVLLLLFVSAPFVPSLFLKQFVVLRT